MADSAPFFSAFKFQVTFTPDEASTSDAVDVTDAGFSEVQGLEANVELKSIAEGGRFQGSKQLIGRTTYQNIVLKRGLSQNVELWRWFAQVAAGTHPVPRKSMQVDLLDPAGENVIARWKVAGAVPIKMKVSDFNAKSGEIAIEEMTVAHEGFDVDFDMPEGT
jgi:phage tail-like protein